MRDQLCVAFFVKGVVLELAVQVFDHDDRRIHHHAQRHRNSTERHDVGRDALKPHEEERAERSQGQRDQHHHAGPRVQQEHEADEQDHGKFFRQLGCEIRRPRGR